MMMESVVTARELAGRSPRHLASILCPDHLTCYAVVEDASQYVNRDDWDVGPQMIRVLKAARVMAHVAPPAYGLPEAGRKFAWVVADGGYQGQFLFAGLIVAGTKGEWTELRSDGPVYKLDADTLDWHEYPE